LQTLFGFINLRINKIQVTLSKSNLLSEGLYNWKLRLILSAILSIFGLATLISMALGLFISLSVLDKTIVSIAISIVGVPTYLILSNLAKIDEYTIAGFLNQTLKEIDGDTVVLARPVDELDDHEKEIRQKLEDYFKEHPVYQFLPAQPVMQAYILFLISFLGSLAIWYFG